METNPFQPVCLIFCDCLSSTHTADGDVLAAGEQAALSSEGPPSSILSSGRRIHVLWRTRKVIFNRPAVPALSPYESLLTTAFTEKKLQGIEKIKSWPALRRQRQGGCWSRSSVPVLHGQRPQSWWLLPTWQAADRSDRCLGYSVASSLALSWSATQHCASIRVFSFLGTKTFSSRLDHSFKKNSWHWKIIMMWISLCDKMKLWEEIHCCCWYI